MDKRIERTRRAACTAALALLAERGYAGFTMEAVAAAAGIAKSTLYRQWPTRIALIATALETLNVQPAPAPEEGDLRARVLVLIRHLAEVMASSRLAACLPALVDAAARHPEVAAFLHGYTARRRARLEQMLDDGVAGGELPAGFDTRMAALALSGPVFYRRLMTPDPFPAAEAADLVDLVLGPALPRPIVDG